MNKTASIILVVVVILQLCIPGYFLFADMYTDYSNENTYKIKVSYLYIEDESQPLVSLDINYYSLYVFADHQDGIYLPLEKDENGFVKEMSPTSKRPKGDYLMMKKVYDANFIAEYPKVVCNSQEDRLAFLEKAKQFETSYDVSYYEAKPLKDAYVVVTCRNRRLVLKEFYVGGEKLCEFE